MVNIHASYYFGPVCHGLTVADCSIRAPSDHRVGATPRGVSPRPRALCRPCKPRHPPRAHPCVIIPVRVSRTRAHAGQESAPIYEEPAWNSVCCSSSATGLDRSRHDTPLSTFPCGTSNEVESGGAPVRCQSRGLPIAVRDPRLRPPRRRGDATGSTGYWGQDPLRYKRPRARPWDGPPPGGGRPCSLERR
jgi:hypothetical protein